MTPKLAIPVLVAILAVGSLSSFADTADFPLSGDKKEDLVDKNDSSNESNEDSKEKRSQENIMFGNQQNKGIVVAGELIGINENLDSSTQSEKENAGRDNDTKKADMDIEEAKIEDALKDDKMGDEDKKNLPVNAISDNLEMDPGGSEEWYDTVPVAPDAYQYLMSTGPLQTLPDEPNSLYDRVAMYRRKRQLRPKALRKRSLRSPLGQMIQTRGRRLPRRSMRLKRQVEMQDLLSLLNNAEPNNAGKFYDQTVPNNFNDYRYPEPASFHHPYNFLPHDKNYLDENLANVMNDINENKDEDELLGFSQTSAPMGSRYFDPEDLQLLDVKSRNDDDEDDYHQNQNWRGREVAMPSSQGPSIFTVSRRSTTPLFYPIDYRFVPGFKKRSSFSGRGLNDEQETEFGKWGRVINVPEAYASAEDVARLYDLANLLAESENSEARVRRSV